MSEAVHFRVPCYLVGHRLSISQGGSEAFSVDREDFGLPIAVPLSLGSCAGVEPTLLGVLHIWIGTPDLFVHPADGVQHGLCEVAGLRTGLKLGYSSLLSYPGQPCMLPPGTYWLVWISDMLCDIVRPLQRAKRCTAFFIAWASAHAHMPPPWARSCCRSSDCRWRQYCQAVSMHGDP